MSMRAQKREYYFCLNELVQGFAFMLGSEQSNRQKERENMSKVINTSMGINLENNP